jgi:hypothetical protein
MKFPQWFAVSCLGLACGCSTLDISSKCKSLWPAGQEKPQQPASIVAMWTEGVVHPSGGASLRGFAGRVIFYGRDGTKPVKVDGTLTVYTFDEAGRGKADAKPDRKYVFTPEQLASHYDPVKVGPAYALWVPWDEASGPRKEISMIVRFVPRKGELVVGEMTRLVLNGAAQPVENLASHSPGGANAARMGDPQVRPAAYEMSVPNQPGEPASPGIRSTTIPLPDNLTRQIASARSTGAGVVQRNGSTIVVPAGVASRIPLTASAGQAPIATAPSAAGGLPSRPSVLPGAHSPLARPRVPGVAIAPLTRDHALLRQSPATAPYSPESTPPQAPLSANASIVSDVPSPRN